MLELTNAEEMLCAFDTYSGQPSTKAALQLSALLFQRTGNIWKMEWAWIDFDRAMRNTPSASMKRAKMRNAQWRPHFVHLAVQATASAD